MTAPDRNTPGSDVTADPHSRSTGFPVVGIGASAGGLEAFTELLSALPIDTGMAFVLVQHLDPGHKSQLTELLSHTTALPVHEAADGMPVEPNQIYVIPANSTLTIADGTLRLSARPAAPNLHLPVDIFFTSLAEAQGPLSVGVVLSGTASDGAQGLKAIKEKGGITFAQDEQTAKHSGMPRSAVATGATDFVLPPTEIAAELAKLSGHAYMSPPSREKAAEATAEEDGSLKKIIALLHDGTHVNFACYKQGTLRRRIGRRLIVRRCDTLAEYLDYLTTHPEELQELYKDILISVTCFFRDPAVFTALSVHLAALVRDAKNKDAIRAWIPGCATGEEIYSIAICFDEISRASGRRLNMQLFGTDISEPAIDRARSGLYPETIASAVSPDRLQRYFAKVDGGYQIRKFIRDTCIFARQDVTVDPPFSRLDLVSCRNLLIYLAPGLHRTVLPMFHYSLNPDGLLLLGTAEGVGADADLFQAIDQEHRIYRRKAVAASRNLPFPTYRNPAEPVGVSRSAGILTSSDLHKKADETVQARYAPDAVVVNEDLQIVQFRGRTGLYLEPAPGSASMDLMRMARESLQPALRKATAEAIESAAVARAGPVRIEYGGEVREINLEVIPISAAPAVDRYFLVVFEQRRAESRDRAPVPLARKLDENPFERIAGLERELAEAREYIRTVTQEHETALEELRAANEEAASANEELQSINEELGTAQEELQSTNEELNTVNDELQRRNNDLRPAV